MDSNHMMEIVKNLMEFVLSNASDKACVRERLAEMGWTDWDLEWFNLGWMFKEV